MATSNAVSCIVVQTPLSYERVLELPRSALTRDWFDNPVSPPVLYTVAADPRALWFLAECAREPICNPALAAGEFVEGLWEAEVAEIFLLDETPGSTRYQEFNLSPTGAWWTSAFHSYREREGSSFNPKATGVQCWSSLSRSGALTPTGSGWRAIIQIPLESLQVRVGFSNRTRLNVTAVSMPANDPRFLSANKLLADAPDFHLTEQFEAIRVVAADSA